MLTSGVFTATIAGTYIFSTYAQSNRNNGGPFRLKKNSDVTCELYVTYGFAGDMPGCTTVTRLVVGDKVKVTGSNTDTAEITGSKHGFSGILTYVD